MPQMIGTVLPTRESLESSERHAASVAEIQERTGMSLNCIRRVVGGEVRWYRGDKEFAVVSRSGKIRWFEIREDGYEYAR